MRNPQALPALLPLLAIASAPACSTSSYVAWTTRSQAGLVDTTSVDVVEFDCPDEAVQTVVTFGCDVRGGDLRLRLTDPIGRDRWSAQGARGPESHEVLFAPIAGTWRLEVDLADFSGDYRAAFEAVSATAERADRR